MLCAGSGVRIQPVAARRGVKEVDVKRTVAWMTGVWMLMAVLGRVWLPLPALAADPASDDMTPKTSGKVVTTMNAGGYTYVEVDDGSKKLWAAAPQFSVHVGDTVTVPPGMPMRNFASKSLGRTFDVVAFVGAVQVTSSTAPLDAQPAPAHGSGAAPAGGAMPPNPHAGGGAVNAPAAGVDLKDIKKAAGGQTVAELFADSAALSGKAVKVRGRVVKFTANVMGKNWLHLQDGSGGAGSNDLVVSTAATAAVGDLVLVSGTLATDRDLGFGYHYKVLIEDAEVKTE